MKKKSMTKTKRAAPLERAMASRPNAKEIGRIQDKYVRIVKMCGKWNVYLQIDHQGFSIETQTTKKRAEWIGAMLGIALERLVRNESGKLAEESARLDWLERHALAQHSTYVSISDLGAHYNGFPGSFRAAVDRAMDKKENPQ